MAPHPIEGLMTTAMENLKDMVEVNTIIGDPVESPDGSVIIPVSKVGFGFAAGGSEFSPSQGGESNDLPFGGGSGGGVSIKPIAFLIVKEQDVNIIHLDQQTHIYERILELAPQAFSKIEQMIQEAYGTDHEQKGKKDKDEKNKDQSEKNQQHSGNQQKEQTHYDI